jgi:predicted acetyltransferase
MPKKGRDFLFTLRMPIVNLINMNQTQLVIPNEKYEKSYYDLLYEYESRKEVPIPFTLSFEYDDFRGLLKRLHDCSKGINIPDGFVPHSSFWLIDAHDRVIGVSNVRHGLTDKLRHEGGHIGYGIRPSERKKGYGTILLKKSLEKAREIGISKALITCDKQNLGSVGVILKNDGKFDSEEFIDTRGCVIQRYWIEL